MRGEDNFGMMAGCLPLCLSLYQCAHAFSNSTAHFCLPCSCCSRMDCHRWLAEASAKSSMEPVSNSASVCVCVCLCVWRQASERTKVRSTIRCEMFNTRVNLPAEGYRAQQERERERRWKLSTRLDFMLMHVGRPDHVPEDSPYTSGLDWKMTMLLHPMPSSL